MADDEPGARLTPLGREQQLAEHEERLDNHERRITDIERKEAGRDRRWDIVLRAVITIGTGIVIAVVSGLIAGGVVHP